MENLLMSDKVSCGKVKPFISVVIPVYNMAARIGRCLDSIVGQSFKDVEIIVVDDGSTDGTTDIIKEYASRDTRVRYFRQENSGVSVARNLGIGIASGMYLLFVDADDEIEDGYLQNIADTAKSTMADILVWGIKRCFENGSVEEWKPDLKGSYGRQAFLEAFPRDQYWHHVGLYGFVSNKLLKKSIIDRYNLRFDRTMILMEDYDFFLSSYAHCESFYCFPETGYRYHIYGNTGGPVRYKDSLFGQLIGVQTKCADLLKSEGALTDTNERILNDAIGGLSIASFLEMRKATYSKVKTCMDTIWDNPYCIPALNRKETSKTLLKRLILKRNIPITLLFVRAWRLYLSLRLKKKR
ncbi:MAG: glycosyltransferase family 2 protein [Bacteroidales bacterium]|nr:glycosyltransferase family 2 protein [Bacteroidales bacterium]